MTYRLLHGKIESFTCHYHGEKFHALLCDPPYHLVSPSSNSGSQPIDGVHGRFGRIQNGKSGNHRGGFMGKKWDGGDVAFIPETWAMLTEHLYDGAFGMAFASSRGWHRLACAIEDAGLIIHPSIFGWAFGSGFPKATRIDTQIQPRDKQASAGMTRHRNVKPYDDENGWNANNTTGDFEYTTPTDPLAAMWAGHRYGLQALKPALEPIIVFQKPYRGKPVECITQTGAGALWIDGARIGSESHIVHGKEAGRFQPTGGDTIKDYHAVDGRWPANLVLSHSPSCNGTCADGCAVKMLGEQGGNLKSGKMRAGQPRSTDGGYCGDFPSTATLQDTPGDAGTAARFFFNADWQYEVAEQLANADSVRYQAKASRSERDAGLDGFAQQRISGMVSILDSGTHGETGKPNKPIYTRNPHPTVKPIALARWLATLLLPPAAYAPRRILVPFAGVASEMIGASLAGWDVVVGIEQDAEYCEIGEARLKYFAPIET